MAAKSKQSPKDKAKEEAAKKTIAVAEKTMCGDLMKLVMEQAKALPKPWQQLSEQEQRDYLARSETQIKAAITHAVDIIASQDFMVVEAQVESVTFKDGVKAVMKLTPGSKGRHELADAEGRVVKLVIGETAHLTEGGGKPKAEKQQKSLNGIEDPDAIQNAEDGARGSSKNTKH